MDHLPCLVYHCRNHAWMRVSERVHAESAHQIEVAVSIDIDEGAAFATIHDDGITGVNGNQVLFVPIQDLLGRLVDAKMFHTFSSHHRPTSVKRVEPKLMQAVVLGWRLPRSLRIDTSVYDYW
jgi:hypothetical protein